MKPHDVVDVLSGPYAGLTGQVIASLETSAVVRMQGFEPQVFWLDQLKLAEPPTRWEQRDDAQQVAQYARERMLERACTRPPRSRHVVAEQAMDDKTATCLSCGEQLRLDL